jgi:actin-related protein 2
MRGYGFNSTADFETVREIKEALCYASKSLKTDRRLADETTALEADYQLPDGSWIKVGRERFEATEAIFKPYLVGREEDGISDMIFNSIMGLGIDQRPVMFESIILSGGSTMYPGMSDRIKWDLRKLHTTARGKQHGASTKLQINVIDPPNRKHLVYVGGSTLADLMAEAPTYWKTKMQYIEYGADILLDQRIAF